MCETLGCDKKSVAWIAVAVFEDGRIIKQYVCVDCLAPRKFSSPDGKPLLYGHRQWDYINWEKTDGQ